MPPKIPVGEVCFRDGHNSVFKTESKPELPGYAIVFAGCARCQVVFDMSVVPFVEVVKK